MLAAGGFGYTLFTPSTSGAQTTSVPAAGATSTTTPGAGGFHSNEDPAHEKGESARRAKPTRTRARRSPADGPGGHFTPNEDPTHEKGESTQREAEENAGRVPTAP